MRLPDDTTFPTGHYMATMKTGGGVILLDPVYRSEQNCLECKRAPVDGMDKDLQGTIYVDLDDVKVLEPVGPEKLLFAQQTSTDRAMIQRIQSRLDAEKFVQAGQQAGIMEVRKGQPPEANTPENPGAPIHRIAPPRR